MISNGLNRSAVTVPGFLRRELIRACKGKAPDDFVFPGARGGVLRVRASGDRVQLSGQGVTVLRGDLVG